MLRELDIENLAVIQKANICFSEKLNIFTGETGAGKSVLINSINAVLGHRMSKDIVRTGCEKATVSALFEVNEETAKTLDKLGVTYENNEILISREIHSDGGSTARINGKASTVSMLKEIGITLVNIHGQHDNRILLSPEKHMQIIDNFGGEFNLLDDYQSSFRELQLTARKLGELVQHEKLYSERVSMLNERIKDIGELEIDIETDSEIDSELSLIKNSEKTAQSLRNVYNILSGNLSANVVEMMMDVESEISEYTELSKEISELNERLSSLRIETEDISNEFLKLSQSIEFDAQRLEYLTERKNKLNHMMRKYSADIDGLCALYNEALEEVENFHDASDEIKKLSEKKEKLLLDVTEKAKKLSEYRKKVADKLVKQVTEELRFLNMPDAILEVRHEKGKLTINGMDSMEILISANKGETPKPVDKIASGGELSRIMLGLKSVTAEKDSVPTLIFDEIDTGVSGRAAQKIGVKLKEIGKVRQVICVTHLSQIAVMADNHLMIEKKTLDNRTFTEVSKLDFQESVKEVARILGGDNPSELMLKNAEEEIKKWRFE